MTMRIPRTAAAAAALLALAAPARAQRQDDQGLVTAVLRTARPVRVAYRSSIDVLLNGGYPISMMLLDEALVTPERMPDGKPARSQVQLLFGRVGDSTQVTITAVMPDASGRDICRSDRCLSGVLAIEAMLYARLDTALKRVRPQPRTAADALAAARALGYAPQNPIKVFSGRLEDGDRSQRAYLDALRGPRGERITYFRLGSCCEFQTPRGHEGTGRLDAYEVRYPGLAKPIVLYMDLYTPAPPGQGIPQGFTRAAAPAARR
jgi:hypothetical protein